MAMWRRSVNLITIDSVRFVSEFSFLLRCLTSQSKTMAMWRRSVNLSRYIVSDVLVRILLLLFHASVNNYGYVEAVS